MMPILAAFWVGLFWAAVKLVAVMAISYGVAYLFRPKPTERGGGGVEDIRIPNPTIGRSFPIVFGTPPRYEGANLLWYGDFSLGEKKRSDTTVAYYYYLGMHLGLCLSGIDGVKQIWYGEKTIWPAINNPASYAADGQTSGSVAPEAGETLYGGYKRGGGWWGSFAIQYGASNQARSAYLTSKLGTGPAMRGFVGLIFGRGQWGTSPYFRTVGVVLKATDKLTDGSAQWYAAKSAIATYGLNPAHIIRQCLTDSQWGESRSADLMGDSFTTVADTLHTEGLGLSYLYEPGPGRLLKLIDEVLETIDGYLYEDHATGKFELGLCRGDYSIDDLDEYDEGDFEIVEFHRPGYGDVPGRVILTHRDRSWPRQRPTVVYEDIAVIANQGGKVVEVEVDRPFVCDATVANEVVARMGRAMTSMGAVMTLRAKRTMSGLHIGSVFRLVYNDDDLAITQMAVRVARIDYGCITDEAMEIDVVEDVFGAAYTIYGDSPETGWSLPSASPSESEIMVSSSPSASPSASVSSSPSSSPSASISSSPSESPSASISSSPSESPSASVSGSPSASESSSPSASPSSSPSSSAS